MIMGRFSTQQYELYFSTRAENTWSMSATINLICPFSTQGFFFRVEMWKKKKKPSHAWSFSIQPTNDPLVIFLLLFAEIAFHKTLGRLLLCGPGKNHFPALRKKRQSPQNLNAHLQRSVVPFSMLGWLHFLFSYWQRIFIYNAELNRLTTE